MSVSTVENSLVNGYQRNSTTIKEHYREGQRALQRGACIMAIDPDTAVEILSNLIREQGDVVCMLSCDSGGMAGGGCDFVYKFAGNFWAETEAQGLNGPCDSLIDALGDEFCYVGDAHKSIKFKGITISEYLKLLTVQAIPGHVFEINGTEWVVNKAGKLVRHRRRSS